MTPNDEKAANERVKQVTEHIETAVESVAPKSTAKHALARRIVNIFKTDFATYYRKYPSRALDQRSLDNEIWVTEALKKAIQLLDEYDIRDKPR